MVAGVKPLYDSFGAERPQSHLKRTSKTAGVGILRDAFDLSTWLLIGAALQSALLLLPISRTLVFGPVFALLGWRMLDVFLQLHGLKHNIWDDGVIHEKFTASYPSPSGDYNKGVGEHEVVVLLLGARSQHPLGLLAPQFRQMGDYFTGLADTLETKAVEYGYLGASSYLNNGDRSAASEILTVFYFDSYESLHKFAHGPEHRAAWDWYHHVCKENPHLGIMHETYVSPKRGWEAVYANYGLTGLAATTMPLKGTGGDIEWVSPATKAHRGQMKTSQGRMGRLDGTENDAYDDAFIDRD